jgi:hypothetical protein
MDVFVVFNKGEKAKPGQSRQKNKYGRSTKETREQKNPTGGMDVCILRLFCVVR